MKNLTRSRIVKVGLVPGDGSPRYASATGHGNYGNDIVGRALILRELLASP